MKKIYALLVLTSLINSNASGQMGVPYSYDFESGPALWTVDTNAGGSAWQLGTPNFGSTTGAHSGTNAWDIDLNAGYSDNSSTILNSPLFGVIPVNSTLSFWTNYNTESNWDGTRIDYSTDGITWNILGDFPNTCGCQTNWYNLATINSSGLPGWSGNSSGWTNVKYTFTSTFPFGPQIQFRFIFTSDAIITADGFSIDDFSIYIPQPDDAGVFNIIRPYPSSAAGYPSPVAVQISNYGNNNLTSFDVSYSLNGGIPITQTWTGLLIPGTTDTIVFPNITVPTGSYNICAYTSMPGDPNNTNDTMCVQRNGVLPFIDIMNYPDTTANPPCDIPFLFSDFIYGTTLGLNFNDTVLIHTAWGDGTDTTYTVIGNTTITLQVQHLYTFAGQFSIQYIASALGGTISDTITMYNQVILSDSCATISGTVYFDANANCIYDAGDTKLYGIPVQLKTGGNNYLWDFSDANGNYDFNAPIGLTYDVLLNSSVLYSPICPASGIYPNISVLPSTGNDFALDATPGYDLQPTISSGGIRPNFNCNVYLTMHNNLLLPVMGELRFPVDTNSFNYVSAIPPPSSISGDTLIWNSGLLGYNTGNFNALVILFGKPTLQIGDTICLTAIAEPIAADSFPLNNIAVTCRPVTNSVDPNDKNVTPSGAIQSNTELTYTINFQNTGNDTAFNVFLLDTIDASLDISTMRILANSHPMSTLFLNSEVIKFSFNNINLPDSNVNEPSSHGYVTYSIKPLAGLMNGTVITNSAHIYFDFNPDVATNTTFNIISNSVGVSETVFENESFILFPNPATDQMTLALKNNSPGNFTISDLMGKKMLEKNISRYKTTIDLKNIPAGIYFVSVEQDGNVVRKKIVVMH